jgi:hypothetical protein
LYIALTSLWHLVQMNGVVCRNAQQVKVLRAHDGPRRFRRRQELHPRHKYAVDLLHMIQPLKHTATMMVRLMLMMMMMMIMMIMMIMMMMVTMMIDDNNDDDNEDS